MMVSQPQTVFQELGRPVALPRVRRERAWVRRVVFGTSLLLTMALGMFLWIVFLIGTGIVR